MTPLRSAVGVAAMALLLACHSSDGAPAPTGLSAPLPGSVIGNWIVDGGSISVVADTGKPHVVRGGNRMRIDATGVEVLLDAFIRADGAYHHRMVWSGATPVVSTSAAGASFDCTIVVDYSARQKKPPLTDYRIVACSGVVRNGVLQVSYLVRVVLGGKEEERDELLFACRPGDAVLADMTGTWEVTGFEVIEDTDHAHGLAVGDLLVVSGGKVEQLFAADYVEEIFRGVAVRPAGWSVPTFAGALTYGSKAGAGRVEGVLLENGVGLIWPDRPPRLEVTFDFIRSGDEMSGMFHLRLWTGSFLGYEVDVLAVTLRLRN